MINNTSLVGRITKNIEVRYTGGGTAVANFTLAVERNFKNAQGEKQTDFINCVIWGKSAEILGQFAVKGSLVGVTGSIETGSYDKDGQTYYTTEVNVQNFNMLEPKEVNDRRRQTGGSGSNYSSGNNSYKKAPTNNDDNPFDAIDATKEISDDDYPF